MKVFSYDLFSHFTTLFHMYSFTCPRQIISVENLTEHSLDWISEKCSLTSVSGYSGVMETWSHVPRLKGFFFFRFFFLVCFSQPLWVLNTKQYGVTKSVKQNLLLSGYLYGVLHHLIFCWVILYCLWCSDPDLGHFLTTTESADKQSLKWKQKWKRL